MAQLAIRSSVLNYDQAKSEAQKYFEFYHPNQVFDIDNVNSNGITFSLMQDSSKKIYFKLKVGFDLKSLPKSWQKIVSDLIPTKTKKKKKPENAIIPDVKEDEVVNDPISDNEEE